MAELATTARPYARAAFTEAGARARLAPWSAFLARAAAVLQDPQVEPLIGNPRVASGDLVELLLAAGPADPAAAPTWRNFLQLLADNRRLRLLPEIAAQFEQLRADAEQIARVEVISALELTSEQSQQLQAALERRLGRKVQLSAQVDRTLLGGAVVRHGDFVVDGSLRGRIERLATSLNGA
jgi:F-type H+-transporting ATPase subunit delta